MRYLDLVLKLTWIHRYLSLSSHFHSNNIWNWQLAAFCFYLLKSTNMFMTQVYWWHDKYRPRKPKYFNRVHTGYEWNKYNQTHYDHDNPPPKIVQGYKFNIFYPDLVDKTKAPVYTIERDGNSSETCIIRFHAGPPYEDIVSTSYSLL